MVSYSIENTERIKLIRLTLIFAATVLAEIDDDVTSLDESVGQAIEITGDLLE
jgi:hypothetical protein